MAVCKGLVAARLQRGGHDLAHIHDKGLKDADRGRQRELLKALSASDLALRLDEAAPGGSTASTAISTLVRR